MKSSSSPNNFVRQNESHVSSPAIGKSCSHPVFNRLFILFDHLWAWIWRWWINSTTFSRFFELLFPFLNRLFVSFDHFYWWINQQQFNEFFDTFLFDRNHVDTMWIHLVWLFMSVNLTLVNKPTIFSRTFWIIFFSVQCSERWFFEQFLSAMNW